MPVVADDGELIGIISATDLFMAAEEIGWARNIEEFGIIS